MSVSIYQFNWLTATLINKFTDNFVIVGDRLVELLHKEPRTLHYFFISVRLVVEKCHDSITLFQEGTETLLKTCRVLAVSAIEALS